MYSFRFSLKTQYAKIFIALGLAALVWIVFGQTAHFDWSRYDDGDYVYRSERVTRGLSPSNVSWAFTHFHAHNWHPITTLSHMLDCQLFGVNPGPHHVSSVIIHGLAAIALFFALTSLTGKIWRSAFVAAVFAIHPLRAESVAWIAERKDVLSGLFFMLTLLAWSSYAKKPSAFRYVAAFAAAALGLLSKPMLVTVPFVLLLIDYWPLQRLTPRRLGWLVLEKIPFACLAAVSAIGTVRAQQDVIASMNFPLTLRLENAIVSCVVYLRQLIWPVDLAVLYQHPENFFPPLIFFGSALLLLGLSVSAIVFRKRLPFLFTGWFWYLGMLVPVLGIVQIGRHAHTDRYTYLPLIGITIAIVWSLAELRERWRFQRAGAVVATACVLLALVACARHQTGFWRNPDALWTHTLAVTNNNDGAHLAFATALFAEGKTDEAIAHVREAARIRPSNAGTFGEIPLTPDAKQVDAGIVLWSARLDENPDDVNAHNNLGVLLVQKHQAGAAVAQWERALQISPQDGNAQSDLAWVLATAPDDSLRDGTRAVAFAENALQQAGGVSPILHRTLAAAYAEVGRFDEAIATAERGRAFAEREGNHALANELAGNVASYKQHQPLRDASLQLRED